jgi:hypothetical protein
MKRLIILLENVNKSRTSAGRLSLNKQGVDSFYAFGAFFIYINSSVPVAFAIDKASTH